MLMPMASENPTVTSVRVKSMLTGALNAFFEVSENFGSAAIEEDNVLYQLKKADPSAKVVFAGDYIWEGMFGAFFDRTYAYPSFNVRDLDSLDVQAGADILKEIEANDFRLLIGHIIGVDHAGHTYSARHSEIERKLNDTEVLIRKIITRLNEETVLLVFGDHGMTEEGNHGGASEQELRSVLFAYSRGGFNHRNSSYDKAFK